MTIVATALLLLIVGGACDREGEGDAPGPGPSVERPEREGEPRQTALGLSALPGQQTITGYVQAFATAAEFADVVLIQRTPPWEDFLPGGTVSADTADTTRFETELLDQYNHLGLFFAIDPTDSLVARTRIAGLPAEVNPADGFSDERLRNAFLGYTAYVVANYEPDYLALGVEINMLYSRNRPQFDAFVELYRETYDAVKAARPETRVFPTFQFEDLIGQAGEIHAPQWEVLAPFAGKMDALALSTYPFRSFTTVADIPPDYYEQVKAHWDGEVLVAETGHTSAPVDGFAAIGSEEDQRAFVQRLAAEADAGRFSLVVWYASRDPGFASEGPASKVRWVGLRATDGTPKLAWDTWVTWTRRPLE